ncbi:MAG: hypothetical protein QOJ03_417 [Frankiaceae bacterium]|jgi:endonuclease/exonuclease/phosphatase family metal-dependent hydrolase|nr:hypothetical protein [Frankiaceae bacterium]
MAELRLLSYNVRSLRDDAWAVSDVIRACAPDVVAVQEAPRFLRWRSKRAELARRSALLVATADRPGGLMLMTTLATTVVGTSFTLLPKSPRLHQRAVCTADVELHGARWRVASIHFSLDRDERQRHLPAFRAAVGSDSSPLVVAGDVNEGPKGAVWQALSEQWQDAYAVAPSGEGDTFSTHNRRKRIDGIFADRRVEVVECRVVDDVEGVTAASDHYPVLAVLRQ